MNLSRLLPALRPHKFLTLLVALLLLAVLDPLVPGKRIAAAVFDLSLCLVFVAGIFAVSRRRRLFLLALTLGVPALIATWVIGRAEGPGDAVGDALVVGRLAVQLLFLGFVVGRVLYEVMQGERVTTDRLCGAMCVYLLLGVIWTLLYSMILQLQPGAFAGELLDRASQGGPDSLHAQFSVMAYYSFVTLSTLGYGDILPVSVAARTFSWLEAVTGQLYLAVLIARLVGLHIAHARGEQ